jgi:hypothetical protein
VSSAAYLPAIAPSEFAFKESDYFYLAKFSSRTAYFASPFAFSKAALASFLT